MAVTLPRFIPLLGDDSLVEADTPFLDWMANAAGGPDKNSAMALAARCRYAAYQPGEERPSMTHWRSTCRGSWVILRRAGRAPGEASRGCSIIGSHYFVATRCRWLAN